MLGGHPPDGTSGMQIAMQAHRRPGCLLAAQHHVDALHLDRLDHSTYLQVLDL